MIKIGYTSFDGLLNEDVAYETLRGSIYKGNKISTKRKAASVQKKIIKKFIRILVSDLLNHGKFFFPKRRLTLQIANTKKKKKKYDYATGNTYAVAYLRTSRRFFKELRKVKPYVRMKNSLFYKAQQNHLKTNYTVK